VPFIQNSFQYSDSYDWKLTNVVQPGLV